MSACKHPDFVAEVISVLFRNGCIVEHNLPPYFVNPFTMAEGKKSRLVIDLRQVKEFLVKPKFKYEDLSSLSQVIEENHWFFFLGSQITTLIFIQTTKSICVFRGYFRGTPRYFTFSVLPFGLSTACFCFANLMRSLVK